MTTGRINQVTILTPRSHPEVTTQGSTPGGAEVVIGRSEDGSKLGPGFTSPVKKKLPRPSICPHWVPQGVVHHRGPRGPCRRWQVCDMHASRGGYPGPVTSKIQRLSGGAYPRKSDEILSQRPTIHRPQHTRTARPFGVRLSNHLTTTVTEARPLRSVKTGDRCRGWNVLRTLSPQSKIPQVRKEEMPRWAERSAPRSAEAQQWRRHPAAWEAAVGGW